MNTFEITLQRRLDTGWPVVVEQAAGDGSLALRSEGSLALEPAALLALEADPRAYGTALGQALFRDGVRDAFAAARARATGELRVLLDVEAPDLKGLRWERLCAPLDGGWQFLALDQRVPFSLYLPSLTDQRFPPIGRRDLRALVLVASPDGLASAGLAPFDAGATIASVRAALGEIPADVLAAGEGTAGPPTLDALCERLTAAPYSLLHLVCHGRLLRDGPRQGETVLYLAGADGQVAPVGASELIARLAGLGGARGLPRLAFLCACESASAAAEATGALGGLAQRLVRELGMPAVVAMSDRVSVATAEALAGVFYRRLREHGEVDRALVEASAGLAGRPDATVPALYSRLGGLPLFSDALDRPLTAAEIGDGLERLEALLPVRAPILGPQVAALTGVVRGSLGADPAALSPDARAARETALAAIAGLCSEVTDLSFAGLALGETPPAYDDRQPFRGLSPFGPADREFFFGREALVARLGERLAEHPFLAVLGPSGSGKSSLVLAGLLPALGGDAAVFSPGADPVAQLETALAAATPGALVVVDQFEEAFTLCPDEARRTAFITQLLALVPGRRVVLTMRADFWGECASYPALRQAMQAHQELIAAMDATELRRAMEGGAAAVGLRFEADLSTTILDEVAGEPGAMPLLGQALLELWQRRHGRWLLAAEYRAIGGVREAIAHTADELYLTLRAPDQERVQDIFVRLTRLDDADVAAGLHRDTRRRVGLAELVPAGADPAPTRALLARLADARLVVTSVNAVTGEQEVEVVHEALIRYWPRLRQWLDEGRADLRLREAIRQAALDWQVSGKSDALLVHRAGRLDDALRLSKEPRYALNTLEQAYLDAALALRGREQQRELEQARALTEEQRQRAEAEARARTTAERATRRQRYFSLGLAVLLVASIATAAYAVVQRQAADEQRQAADVNATLARDQTKAAEDAKALAEQRLTEANDAKAIAETAQRNAEMQARIARSRQLAAQSLDELTSQLDVGLLLGVEALSAASGLDMSASFEARSTLLAGQLASPYLSTFLRADAAVLGLTFSPDGTKLVSASSDGVIIWDVAKRQPMGDPLRGHPDRATSVAFSPDGQMLALGSAAGTISYWDLSTRKWLGDSDLGHSEFVESIAFSPDGRTLAATGEATGMITLWDVFDRGAPKVRLARGSRQISSLAFSPDGTLLASAEWDPVSPDSPGQVVFWDRASNQPLGQPLTVDAGEVSQVAFSPDGALLAAGTRQGVILFDVRHRERVGDPLEGQSDEGSSVSVGWPAGLVSAVAFHPSGSGLASARYDDSAVTVWDVAKRSPILGRLVGHRSSVLSLAFSPDGRTFASGGADGTVTLWDGASRQRVGEALPRSAMARQWALSPDGAILASVVDEGIRLWDVPDRKPLGDLPAQPDAVRALAFSADGTAIAVASSGDGGDNISFWDVATRQERGDPLRARGLTTFIAFSPDGKTLAASTYDGFIEIWDWTAPVPRGNVLLGDDLGVLGLAFSPDGKVLAWAGNGNVGRLDVAQRSVIGDPIQVGRGPVEDVAFSPDGKLLAAGLANTVVLIDAVTLQPEGSPLTSSGHAVRYVAFSPDGALLASGTEEGTIALWDVATRQPLAGILDGGTNELWSVAFSPDGKFLASGGERGVTLWDVDPASWMARSCVRANRNLTKAEWDRYFPGQAYHRACAQFPSGAGEALAPTQRDSTADRAVMSGRATPVEPDGSRIAQWLPIGVARNLQCVWS